MLNALLIIAAAHAVVSLASFSEPAPQDSHVLARYDLGPVIPSFDDGVWAHSLTPELADARVDLPLVDVHELYVDAPAELVKEIVTRLLGEELEQEGRAIEVDRETGLLVLAPAQVQDQVARVLSELEAILTSSTELTLDVFTLDGSSELPLARAGSISDGEAERLAQSLGEAGARHTRHNLVLFPGRTAVVDQTRHSSFLYDYQVEISSGAVAFDPEIAPVTEGLRILARGAAVPEGTVLSLLVTNAELVDGIRERKLVIGGVVGNMKDGGLEEVEGPTLLQTIDLHSCAVAVTTLVPTGGAVVMFSESNHAGRTVRQVLIARCSSESHGRIRRIDMPGSETSLLMVNTERVGSPFFDFDLGGSAASGTSGGSTGAHPYLIARQVRGSDLFLSEWLRYRFSVNRRLGPWVVVVTNPAWDNSAGAELEQLVASIQVSNELVEVNVTLEYKGGKPPVRWSLPVLSGTRCGATLGHTQTSLFDYSTEVAQSASVTDPEVEFVFGGLVFALEVSRRGSEVLARIRGVGQMLQTPAVASPRVGPRIGAIDGLVRHRIEFNARRRLKIGSEVELGSLSAAGSGMRVVLGVR